MLRVSMYRTLTFVPALLLAFSVFAQYQQPPSVTTSGSAELLVDPDQIEFTIGVETMHEKLSVAKALNDDAVAKAIASAKKHQVDPASIQTDYININPNYDSEDQRRTTPLNYTVRRSVIIVSKDIAGFESLLTDLVAAGANHVRSVRFLTTKLRTHRDEARRMATQAAFEKAQLLAKTLGRTAGKPLQITEVNDWWSSPYSSWWGGWNANSFNISANANNTNGGGDSSEGPLAPGRISVKASVNVVFSLD